MAGGTFGVKITGPNGAVMQAAIEKNLAELPRWQEETMRVVGRFGREVMLYRQFEQEGAYLGPRWSPNAADYASWKYDHFGADKIGRRTGAMFDAFTSRELDTFTTTGLRYPTSDETTNIEAVPILEATPDSVKFGAEVSEDGQEYTTSFNEGDGSDPRPILGEGQIPADLEEDLGRAINIPIATATYYADWKGDYAYSDFPSAEVMDLFDRWRPEIAA